MSSIAAQLGATKISIMVAAAIVAASLIALNTTSSNTTAFPSITCTVTYSLEGGNLAVTVSVPPPQYQYLGYQGYGYWGYGYQAGYGYYTVPVLAIVALEKLVETPSGLVPELANATMARLKAYGVPNSFTVTFKDLGKGDYRLKVMCWNDLLSVLSATGGEWVPLSKPYIEKLHVEGGG